jgi:Prp8 binding protein
MLLTGHSAAVLSCKFSPDGQSLVSASHDKTMLLWDVYGECANTLTFRGHANAVLEVHWASAGEALLSASADKTVALWDAKTGGRVRQFKGHTGIVNSCCPARDASTLASGSDDRNVRIWDARVRTCQHTISHPWPVTAVSVAHDGMTAYSGSLDGKVRAYDLRRPDEVSLELSGHQDIVTALRLSPAGDALLSNAMDNVLRCWDVKPYCAGERCERVYLGAQHNYEKGLLKCAWSHSGAQVAAGSADSFVYIWDAATKKIAYKLPGHAGSVNEVDFHPSQPIIASCGNDKQIYLGEIRQ